MTRACIGLGANLGNPHRALKEAAVAIDGVARTRILKRSRIFRSAPIGPGTQNDYLNAAVLLCTELSPRELLRELQAIEACAGRVRTERWGPRTLDLDILTFGTEVIAEADLQIPHPRAVERNFVLAPLQDLLGPDARLRDQRLEMLLAAAPQNFLEATTLDWALGARDCA